jgi:DNA (cytosine-5)-methyltransferase 1
MTTYGSLFTGVGGFDLGCDSAGWECAFQVEWDKKAASVLEHHWPSVPKWSDVSDVNGAELPAVDVITFGFPCQDLSVAGKRAGLDGMRSGLFFEATRIIREMREATSGKYPRTVIAENVRGLLNADRGAAMGRCLDELALIGAVGIEWRVLDAQFFGVPQRRRRVFIVASFNPRAAGRGPILSQPESLPRDIKTSDETRQDVASTLGGSTESSSGELVPMAFSHTAGIDPQPSTTTTTTSKGQSSQAVAFVKARRAQSVDDFETWETDRPAPTLNIFDNGHETRATVLALPQITGTITTAFGPKNYSNLQEVSQGSVQPMEAGVRRLTPRECERLQGWPDDHTRWDADGKENADGPRYKMIGNGVAAPVAQWIAERIEQAL